MAMNDSKKFTKTFTENLKKHYETARHDNKKDNDQLDYYYCATSGGVTKRRLDLEKNDVFCENESVNKKSDRPEYRIQAFLIREAKKNGWVLNIFDKNEKVDWVLIDAERNFAETEAPKKFDLLAYSKTDNAYIILELKKDRAFTVAAKELKRYIELLKSEISGANTVYGKDVSNESVYGYIVAPESKTKYQKNNDSFGYGVIEFNYTADNDKQKKLFTSGSATFNIMKKGPTKIS